MIFHCDDMGFTPSITRRLLDLWKSGFINSFSVLPNGDALEDVSRVLFKEKEREARIAVHLNLFEGRPVSSPCGVPLLTDSSGNLNCGFIKMLRMCMASSQKRRRLLDQVENEWRAQILKVRGICSPRSITAVDGHVHIHMLPFLFPVAVRLALEHGIPQIRIYREICHFSPKLKDSISLEFGVNIIKHVILRLFSHAAFRIVSQEGLSCPESVVGILYSGNMTCASALAGLVAAQRKKAKSVEIVFHAGRASMEESSRWNSNRRAGNFPLSKKRDLEYRELMRFRRSV